MEPLSIVASLVAVLEATAGVTKTTISLYRNVRDAPEELVQLSNRVSQTQSRLALQLQLYQTLENRSLESLIPEGALLTFQADLKRAERCLNSIRGILSAQDGHSKRKQYLNWVMQDKRKVVKILRNLQDIDDNLGSLDLVRFLLDNGATPDDLETRCQMSPLQEACIYGYFDIARLLLANGAFLEHADSAGRTAFTMLWFKPSSQFSRADFLRVLFAYLPMTNIVDPSEPVGPLACAAMKGNVEDLELLTRTGVCMRNSIMVAKTIINLSILASNIQTYDYAVPLLPVGWINEVDDLGRGRLHMALKYRLGKHAREIVKRLLDAGADVHLRDIDGNDPGNVAHDCDKEARSDGLLEPGAPGNVQLYFDALTASGFDVELDEEDNLWWPS
ncbi:MAG: hypothetical protein Q9182_005036 [Xanthomendoza sp. 2 TL-2023]